MQLSPLQGTYLRYVRWAREVESKHMILLDKVEWSLLHQIALFAYESKSLYVGDIISALSDAGSPATLHRRLARLLKEDLIRHGSDIDGRKRQLELTPKALDYFAKLGDCIQRAGKVTEQAESLQRNS